MSSTRAAGWMSAEKLGREGGRSLSLALRRSSHQAATTSGAYRQSKKFPNGDTYSGGWRSGLPEGEGRYCWADGSTYEGGWRVSPCSITPQRDPQGFQGLWRVRHCAQSGSTMQIDY